MDEFVLLLSVILSEIHEKTRKKYWVTKKVFRIKMTCHFKLNMCMLFFGQISRSFFNFLIISWNDFIIFYFAIIFSIKCSKIVYIQCKYTQNQVVYYTVLESQFSFFGLKNFWFLHHILWVVFCAVISRLNGGKYEHLQQFKSD